MNREQVFEVLKLLNDAYPNFDFDQYKINTWAKLLNDQNPAIVMQNAEKYALENKFPPSLSDLRETRLESFTNTFLEKRKNWESEALGYQPRS